MKKSAFLVLAAFGTFALMASCGVEPQEQSTLQSAVKKDKEDKKSVSELFESYDVGSSIPDSYIWVQSGASIADISDIDSVSGVKNLRIQIKQDSPERDYIGVKFCLETGVTDVIAGSFSIRLKNLVNWTGLGVIGDDDSMQYWWWTRQDGTVFNGHTFDSFMTNTWHQVTISVDRTLQIATFELDGNQNYFDLNLEWTGTDPNQPMQCLFVFLGVYDTPQTVNIDDVAILGY